MVEGDAPLPMQVTDTGALVDLPPAPPLSTRILRA